MSSRVASTGIGRAGTKKIDPQNEEQFRTAARGMCAAAKIAQAVESFDGQGQDDQQPADQQAVGMVMADMLEAVTAFGFVEALILDLPTALGHAEQRANSTWEDGKFVSQ